MDNIIEFRTEKEVSEYYHPKKERIEEVELEIRYDPLTKKSSRIVQKPFPIADDPDMSDVEKTGFCPMCPENIQEVGARDSRVLDKELGERGEAVLMANITPYAKYSLVCRLAEDHYLELDEFKAEHFSHAFELLIDYLKGAKKDDGVNFATIIMNYLKPAGSSIVHPHLQMLVSKYPTDHMKRRFVEGKKFHEQESTSYWETLLRKDDERKIGESGSSTWLAAYSPQGFEHIKGISTGNIFDLDVKGLSQGIVNVLKTYKRLEYNSFNISVFVPPLNEEEGFATVVDMVTRSNLDRFYWSDVSSISKLQDEPLVNRRPEDVAADYRDRFE